MMKYFTQDKAAGQPETDLHYFPRACLQASPCPSQFCPSLSTEPELWREHSPGRRTEKGLWTGGSWRTSTWKLLTWGPMLWWEAWSPGTLVPGSHSFSSYLFNKYPACWGHSSEQDKISAGAHSPARHTLTGQINKPTQNTVYCCEVVLKKQSKDKV